jgi:hypothetical protein
VTPAEQGDPLPDTRLASRPGAVDGGAWRAFGWLVTLALPFALIALNVRLLASEPFLRLEYGRPGFPAAPGFTAEERLALAVPSTTFIVSDAPAASLLALRHAGQPLYTAEEVGHLEDVRRVVARFAGLGLAALLVLVGALVAAARGRWRLVGRALARGGWLAVALVGLSGLGVALAWPLLFTGFHVLLFPAGTWQFATASGLIRLFPEPFWYDTALALAALAALEGLLAVRLGRALERRAA